MSEEKTLKEQANELLADHCRNYDEKTYQRCKELIALGLAWNKLLNWVGTAAMGFGQVLDKNKHDKKAQGFVKAFETITDKMVEIVKETK